MNVSLFPEKDEDAERRRALAKVYSLLLHLSEDKEKKPITGEYTGEKNTEELTFTKINSTINKSDSLSSQPDIPL